MDVKASEGSSTDAVDASVFGVEDRVGDGHITRAVACPQYGHGRYGRGIRGHRRGLIRRTHEAHEDLHLGPEKLAPHRAAGMVCGVDIDVEILGIVD